MKVTFTAFLGAAAAGAMTVTALALPLQSQTATGGSQSTATSTQQGQQVTITGCVQRESDYRRARDAGRGGVVGTGVGAGNEFVLVNASMSGGAAPAASATTGSSPTGTAGTTGGAAASAAAGTAYELTGPAEGQVASHVGRRVEIRGTLKPTETTAAGKPTGGATAGSPPAGIDVASKDLKLRELEVSSVTESTGTCPPQ